MYHCLGVVIGGTIKDSTVFDREIDGGIAVIGTIIIEFVGGTINEGIILGCSVIEGMVFRDCAIFRSVAIKGIISGGAIIEGIVLGLEASSSKVL